MLDVFADASENLRGMLNVFKRPAANSVEQLMKLLDLAMSTSPGEEVLKKEKNRNL